MRGRSTTSTANSWLRSPAACDVVAHRLAQREEREVEAAVGRAVHRRAFPGAARLGTARTPPCAGARSPPRSPSRADRRRGERCCRRAARRDTAAAACPRRASRPTDAGRRSANSRGRTRPCRRARRTPARRAPPAPRTCSCGIFKRDGNAAREVQRVLGEQTEERRRPLRRPVHDAVVGFEAAVEVGRAPFDVLDAAAARERAQRQHDEGHARCRRGAAAARSRALMTICGSKARRMPK